MSFMRQFSLLTRSLIMTADDVSFSDSQDTKKTHAKLNWKLIKEQIGQISRDHIEEELRADPSSVKHEHLVRMGHVLIEDGWGSVVQPRNYKAIYAGALLLEWVKVHGKVSDTDDDLLLAKAHCEIWKGNAVVADPYNLKRSHELYNNAVNTHLDISANAETMTEFSKVLQYAGEVDHACKIFMSMLAIFEDRPEFPTYVMFAGGMLKALGDYDKAGSYFFEAMNIGPPRLFSRLDMMFIVARTLEESSADSDEPLEDGYRMVHHHLLSDGFISESLTYEDWINDANTWLKVADKCSIVGIFSLAADLYGQGINRDINAFKKTRLWLGFAKVCARCGKNSEAQLALKQALALDPHNVQCKIALDQLADLSTGAFERLVSGPLDDIVKLIPSSQSRKDLAAARLQALLRGKRAREELKAGNSLTKELRRRLSKVLLLRLARDADSKTFCSLVLRVRSDWNMAIKQISCLEAMSSQFKAIKLDRPHLAPCRVAGVPRKYALEVVALEDTDENGLINSRIIKLSYIEKTSQIYYTQLFEIGAVEHAMSEAGSIMLDSIRIRRKLNSSVATSDHTYFIAKGTILFLRNHYFYRVMNTEKVSKITFHKANNDQTIEFVLKREYFDLTFSLIGVLKLLLGILSQHSVYGKIISSPHDENDHLMQLPFSSKDAKQSEYEVVTTEPNRQLTFQDILGNYKSSKEFTSSISGTICTVTPTLSYSGIVFSLKPQGLDMPIFSHSFELHDGTPRRSKPAVVDILEIISSKNDRRTSKMNKSSKSMITPTKSEKVLDGFAEEGEEHEEDDTVELQAPPIKPSEMILISRPVLKELEGAEVVKVSAPAPAPSRFTFTPNLSGPDGKKIAHLNSMQQARQRAPLLPMDESSSLSSLGSGSFTEITAATAAATNSLLPSQMTAAKTSEPPTLAALDTGSLVSEISTPPPTVETKASNGSSKGKSKAPSIIVPAAAALFLASAPAPAASPTKAKAKGPGSKQQNTTKPVAPTPTPSAPEPVVVVEDPIIVPLKQETAVVEAPAVPADPVAQQVVSTPKKPQQLPPIAAVAAATAAASIPVVISETPKTPVTPITTKADADVPVVSEAPTVTTTTAKVINKEPAPSSVGTSNSSKASLGTISETTDGPPSSVPLVEPTPNRQKTPVQKPQSPLSSSKQQLAKILNSGTPPPPNLSRKPKPRITVVERLFPLDSNVDHEEEYTGFDQDGSGHTGMLTGKDVLSLAKQILDVPPVETLEEKTEKANKEHDRIFAEETEAEKLKLQESIRMSKRHSQASAMNFVKFEQKRTAAMLYLSEVGHKAVISVNRSIAFNYLTERVKDALIKTAHLMRVDRQRSSFAVIKTRKTSIMVKSMKGNGDVNFDISQRRNTTAMKRRQSILESISARQLQAAQIQQFSSKDSSNDGRRSRDNLSADNLSVLSARSESPKNAAVVAKAKPRKPKSRGSAKYFQGNTTDPGYFPPNALTSAADLVAALQGRRSDLSSEGSGERDDTSVAIVGAINQDVISGIRRRENYQKVRKVPKLTGIDTALESLYKELATITAAGEGDAISPSLDQGSFSSTAAAAAAAAQARVSYNKISHPSTGRKDVSPPRTHYPAIAPSPSQVQAKTPQEALSSSLQKFHQVGYTTGDNEYRSYWVEKLGQFTAASAADTKLLAKRLVTLRKVTAGMNMTVSEMFCALADSNGNIGEVIGRLNSADYLPEIRAVCSTVSVEDYMLALGVKSDGPSSSYDEFKISRSGSSVLSAVMPPPHELLRLQAGLNGVPSPANPLPHMGISLSSKIAKKRGNVIANGGSSSQLLQMSSSLTALGSNKQGSPIFSPNTSLRLSKGIEQQMQELAASGASTVVMSRRDALRVLEDELLMKSPNADRLVRGGGVLVKKKKKILEGIHDWVDYANHQYSQHPELLVHHQGNAGGS